MRIFVLKTCDTCRKALKALRDAGHVPEVIDVRADGVSAQTIAAVLAQLGDAVVNKSSATWRGLSDAEKARPVADLLVDHPTLIKRPVIDVDGTFSVGWKPETQAKYL